MACKYFQNNLLCKYSYQNFYTHKANYKRVLSARETKRRKTYFKLCWSWQKNWLYYELSLQNAPSHPSFPCTFNIPPVGGFQDSQGTGSTLPFCSHASSGKPEPKISMFHWQSPLTVTDQIIMDYWEELGMKLTFLVCFPFQINSNVRVLWKTPKMPTLTFRNISISQFSKRHWTNMGSFLFFQPLSPVLRTGWRAQQGLPNTVSSFFLNLDFICLSFPTWKPAVYLKGNLFTLQMVTGQRVLFHCILLCKYQL